MNGINIQLNISFSIKKNDNLYIQYSISEDDIILTDN